MRGLEWGDIRIFLEVARSRSAMRAAERLGLNYTTVTRRINALEEQLGKSLFKRSKGDWVITPVGERILPDAQSMAAKADNILLLLTEDSQELKGVVRVTADYCADRMLLTATRLFVQRYPEVRLQIIANGKDLDLEAGDADIALQVTDTPPPSLVGRRIAHVGFTLYAAHGLLELVGDNPEAPDVPCIQSARAGPLPSDWVQRCFPNTQRIYHSTSLSVTLSMAREGIGVARLPCALGDPDPALDRFPGCTVERGPGLWILSHVNLRNTVRLRIFRDFLVAELDKHRGLIEG